MNESRIDWMEVGITFGACLAAVIVGGLIMTHVISSGDKNGKDEKKESASK